MDRRSRPRIGRSAAQLARLKALAERKKTKEAVLLREGLEDVLRKYDRD
jgi:hypothetical protein